MEGLPQPTSGARVTKMLYEGDTSAAQGPGNKNEDPEQSRMQPDTNKWVPSKGDRTSVAAFGDPEAPDILTNMLRQASVSEEHRTLMSTVVEKVLSAKSGLNDAFASLLRGFEVCNVTCAIVFYSENTPMYRQ